MLVGTDNHSEGNKDKERRHKEKVDKIQQEAEEEEVNPEKYHKPQHEK